MISLFELNVSDTFARYRFNKIEEIDPLVKRLLSFQKESRNCALHIRFNGVFYVLTVYCKDVEMLDAVQFKFEAVRDDQPQVTCAGCGTLLTDKEMKVQFCEDCSTKGRIVIDSAGLFVLPRVGSKVEVWQWRNKPANFLEVEVRKIYIDEDGDFCIDYYREDENEYVENEHWACWNSTDHRWEDGDYPYIPGDEPN